MTSIPDIIEKLEKATGPDRVLDEAVAEVLFGVSVWKSKHGWWNVSFPTEWPYGQSSSNMQLPGRDPGREYDEQTGKRLPPETRPAGWADSAFVDLPAYTESIDAALALTERVLPGWGAQISTGNMFADGEPFVTLYSTEEVRRDYHYEAGAKTLPLALCLATMRALNSTKEPVDG